MTSSLVGSEMCIRDRSSSCCRAAEAALHPSAEADMGLRMVGGGSFFYPVSYTHLTLPTICSV
eukprot:7791204-Prorocentrum_lima.AAC.1